MTQQKRMILIGKTAAGKTTLCQYLTHQDLVYHKTQTIAVMGGQFIDTPGEYLERVRMRGALSVTAAGVSDVISFDISEVLLETELGMLQIKGADLHVNRLSLEKGEIDLEGRIDSFQYSEVSDFKKGGETLLNRLFR